MEKKDQAENKRQIPINYNQIIITDSNSYIELLIYNNNINKVVIKSKSR